MANYDVFRFIPNFKKLRIGITFSIAKNAKEEGINPFASKAN